MRPSRSTGSSEMPTGSSVRGRRFGGSAFKPPWVSRRLWPVLGSVEPDNNQNARDRTVASAYSVRNNPDGRVSCPLDWSEVADVDPADLTLATVPARYAERGDPFEEMDDQRYD